MIGHMRGSINFGPTARFLASAWLAFALIPAFAQAPTDAAPVVRQSARLVVGNRFIVTLNGPIAGYTAKERVATAVGNIEHSLDTVAAPEVSIASAEEGHATRVLVGGAPAFLVTPIDINPEAGETTEIVAREAARRLTVAVSSWHEQRSTRYLLVASALAAGATLIFGTLVWLLFRLNRWAGVRLSAAAAQHARRLEVGGVKLLSTPHVLMFVRRTFTLLAWVITIAFATTWLTFVLVQFPYTAPWGEDLQGNLLRMVKQVALAIAGAMPGLVLVAIIFVIARFIIRVVAVFFDRVESGEANLTWLDHDTARPTRRVFNFVICIFALAMAYPYLPGAGTEAFKGLSVLVGVMFTIGGAGTVGQAFSGLILMYMKAFRKGDFVRIGDVEGTVMELGMFATRIRTGMGVEVVLPNAGIMGGATRNYSRAIAGTGYVVDIVVTIGYGTPWRQVEAMLKEAARRTDKISHQHEPIVRQMALSDYYIEYHLLAYTPAEQPYVRVEVMSDLHGNVVDVFNEHGVQIMSPHYMMDPPSELVVPKDQWYAAPAKPPGKS
jgi:small-conductance mechanosensitive channel